MVFWSGFGGPMSEDGSSFKASVWRLDRWPALTETEVSLVELDRVESVWGWRRKLGLTDRRLTMDGTVAGVGRSGSVIG